MDRIISKTFFAFGTANTITVSFEHKNILDEIKNQMLTLHRKLSIFEGDSEISAVNRNCKRCFTSVSSDTYSIIRQALKYSAETNGAFDISALPLIRLWKNAKAVPNEKAIETARLLFGSENVILNDGSVMLVHEGMGIDLGGIAKGYAADMAANMLRSSGVSDALINFGGTVITIGKERAVGIRNPFKREVESIGTVTVKNKAVVTSGAYERYVTLNGRRYHHIINPRTGYPADTSIVSVTLTGENACELDALATGAFILGMESSVSLLKKRNINAVFITQDGDVFATEDIRTSLKIN